ncbi:FAD-dependent monooxygenase [Streptomyces sp. NPDC003077]|uniref:NAD(P)/FAD-dependent oxidoreductase n=1 Tax=Streptomyces sp. NPDC003077 TaxID=3154443 RepID=UPI0033A5E30F
MNAPNSAFVGAFRPHVAVVLGGGLAGMLAAAVLSEYAEVFVVERDRLPAAPSCRKGLPQAHHAHTLWSGGARVIDELLPGTLQQWLQEGARRISLPSGIVSLTPRGWLRRWPESQYLIACSRDLLDWVVRRQVLDLPGVHLLEGTEAVGLLGTAEHITGVTVRDMFTDHRRRLDADLVVDASGARSAAPRWLSGLGLPAVREEVLDTGLACASRLYRAPAGSEDSPIVSVRSDFRGALPGQNATLVPIEHGQWLVTLSGTRGGHPTKDPDRFEAFARQLRHPLVGELISSAEPLTDVRITHGTANRRRHFERMDAWPTGFTVLGDAVATCNPLYAQGMSVAARQVAALSCVLRKHSLDDPSVAEKVQRGVGRALGGPWSMATGRDACAEATGTRPPASARLRRGLTDRVLWAATGRPAVSRALFDVLSLSAPLTRLMRPAVVAGVVLGPGRPPLASAPLSGVESRSDGQRPAAPLTPAEQN